MAEFDLEILWDKNYFIKGLLEEKEAYLGGESEKEIDLWIGME